MYGSSDCFDMTIRTIKQGGNACSPDVFFIVLAAACSSIPWARHDYFCNPNLLLLLTKHEAPIANGIERCLAILHLRTKILPSYFSACNQAHKTRTVQKCLLAMTTQASIYRLTFRFP